MNKTWLKLNERFFESKEVRLLRAEQNGDKKVCIYLKLLLLSLENGGQTDTLDHDELSVLCGERKPDVTATLESAHKLGLVTTGFKGADYVYKFTPSKMMVKGESDSAERMRRYRERQKQRGIK